MTSNCIYKCRSHLMCSYFWIIQINKQINKHKSVLALLIFNNSVISSYAIKSLLFHFIDVVLLPVMHLPVI